KNIIKEEANFYLIYTKCEIEECIKRDPKGLYKKALKGEIKNFTGIDDPYEEPKKYDLLLDTVKNSVEYNVEKLYNFIKEKINEVENQNK
ncbi:MAG: adenylyl-sulfate kinase, partial [Caldisphaera sp.]